MKLFIPRKRIHSSWVITFYCAGIMLGIIITAILPVINTGIEYIVLSISIIFISIINKGKIFIILAIVSGLLFGVWRGDSVKQDLNMYDKYNKKQVIVSGTVVDDVALSNKGNEKLKITNVQIDGNKLISHVWVSIDSGHNIKRGDFVELEGLMQKGYGNLPASLNSANVLSISRPNPGDIGRRIRDWFVVGVKRAIPDPQANLSIGYLVGQKSTLPETLNNQLRVVGLTHVVVASGYNLTILVNISRRLFARYSKYLALISSTSMIIGFVLITGFSPSMTRAALVAMLGLVAWYYGRTFHPVVLIVISAAITSVLRPEYLWGDVGWYLSFAAFAGVLILAPLIKTYFFGDKNKLGFIKQIMIETLSAQIITMPIILYMFGQYSTYALLANVLVLPLVPLAMLLTFISGIGGLLLSNISAWIGYPAKLVLDLNILVIEQISKLPYSYGDIRFGVIHLVVSYSLLFTGMLYIWKKTKYNFRREDKQLFKNIF